MAIPVYQRLLPSGVVGGQVAGVEAGPGNVFTVPAAAVSGYQPQAGDKVIDANRVKRTVTAVAFDSGAGVWTLTAPPPA